MELREIDLMSEDLNPFKMVGNGGQRMVFINSRK